MKQLVILRGNSGSGKTTVAKALQQKLGSNTMLISQDVIRREMLMVKDGVNGKLYFIESGNYFSIVFNQILFRDILCHGGEERMIDWMNYGKIQEYKRNGLKKSQVARRLDVDYKTILKYWDMSPAEYAEAEQAFKKRRKKADEYKNFVVECLTKYPDMSAAQVYDWIKERTCLETLDFQKRAFRNYVQEIRKEYGIKKPVSARNYEAVDELPMGQQAQVDMGEIKIETITGRYRKVYCFAMVLAHSRYKFIRWQLNPFTTDTFITAHMNVYCKIKM